jgi:hypothetical protein
VAAINEAAAARREEMDEEALKALVRAAVALNESACQS